MKSVIRVVVVFFAIILSSCEQPQVQKYEDPDSITQAKLSSLYPSEGSGMVLAERVFSQNRAGGLRPSVSVADLDPVANPRIALFDTADEKLSFVLLDQEGGLLSNMGTNLLGAVQINQVATVTENVVTEYRNLAMTSADDFAELRSLLKLPANSSVPWLDGLSQQIQGAGRAVLFSGWEFRGFHAQETSHEVLTKALDLKAKDAAGFKRKYGDSWRDEVTVGAAFVGYVRYEWNNPGDFSDDQIVRALTLLGEPAANLTPIQKLWSHWVLGDRSFDELKTEAADLVPYQPAHVVQAETGRFEVGQSFSLNADEFKAHLDKGIDGPVRAGVIRSAYRAYASTEGF